MSRRAVLWVAFTAVHALVAWLGFVLPSQPMGDVYRVYEPWSACALQGGVAGFCPDGVEIMGVDAPWVYPQLALVPMLLTWLFAFVGSYTLGWAVLVTLVDAVAFAVLVGRARSAGRVRAAWFWLAFIALLGPVGMYRLDGLTVPLVLLGCLWLVGRPWLASILLAVATWIKVWPAAILAAAVITVRRRLALVGGAAIVSLTTLAVVATLGGASAAFGFVTDQADRGLQVEAPVSLLYLWAVTLGEPTASVYYDFDLLTFQVTGRGIDPVITAMTPLLVIAVMGVAVLGTVLALRGARYAALFPALALALVLAFIVFNKVGSPQYACWLIPPLALGLVLDRRRWQGPAILGLVIALLTQLVYPVLYDGVLSAAPLPVIVLTVRNLLYAILLGWALVHLVRIGLRRPVGVDAASLAPSP